jgi:outer membrane lipase/esterase
VQLRHFIAQHGTFNSDQVVFLYIGTNDVAYDYDPNNAPALAAELRNGVSPSAKTMQTERTRIERAADQTVQVVRRMLQARAHRLVVFKLPDLGEFPWFRTPASRAFVTELFHVFNRRLSVGLPLDSRILVINVQDYLKDLVEHAPEYGLQHGVHDDACKDADQDFCGVAGFVESDADKTYIAAAEEHLSTRAHELLAFYVLREINEHLW